MTKNIDQSVKDRLKNLAISSGSKVQEWKKMHIISGKCMHFYPYYRVKEI